MPSKITIEKVELLARKLAPAEQLKLVGSITTKLSDAFGAERSEKKPLDQKARKQRLQFAEQLLAECKDINDDSERRTKGGDRTRHTRGKVKSRKERLAKADALLAKLDAIAESIEGQFDSARDIRELREERANRL
jgi:hypothetical protein